MPPAAAGGDGPSSASRAISPSCKHKPSAGSTAFFPGTPAQVRSVAKHHGRLELREICALAIGPDEVGFCAAVQVVRIYRSFRHLKSGWETDESVLGITRLQRTRQRRGLFLTQPEGDAGGD